MLNRGYACDHCGAELFDYPDRRLCEECEGKLQRVSAPCDKCGRQLRAEGLCLDCKAEPPKCTRGFSPFVYKGECAQLVNRMKNGTPRLAAYLGEKMGERLLEYVRGEEALLLIPVPLTEGKERERGYNQAERLAESVREYLLARQVVAETDFELLEKKRETGAQKHKSRKERAENLKGAFHVKKRKACEGRTVVLVDDIMTTGATGSECAARLFGAGAKEVYLLTAASIEEPK